jgi:hypothetical protein
MDMLQATKHVTITHPKHNFNMTSDRLPCMQSKPIPQHISRRACLTSSASQTPPTQNPPSNPPNSKSCAPNTRKKTHTPPCKPNSTILGPDQIQQARRATTRRPAPLRHLQTEPRPQARVPVLPRPRTLQARELRRGQAVQRQSSGARGGKLAGAESEGFDRGQGAERGLVWCGYCGWACCCCWYCWWAAC